MPLLQISIYLSSSRPLHAVWRKGGLQTGSPAPTIAVLLRRVEDLAVCQHGNSADPVHLGSGNGAAGKRFTR